MPVKVIGANGAGSAADIAEGIVWAADHGARVINMSFALSGSDDGIAQAIAYAQARGVLVVAAAAGTADVTFPAAYPGVISVSATDPSDSRYPWSSYGGWVNLAAPGCSIATGAGGSYADFCGTSSATALVSGLAGLMRSYAPSLTSEAVGQTSPRTLSGSETLSRRGGSTWRRQGVAQIRARVELPASCEHRRRGASPSSRSSRG